MFNCCCSVHGDFRLFTALSILRSSAHFTYLKDSQEIQTLKHTRIYKHMMQRKWLIFIILSGSDRDPAVFLLKTSCLTREGASGGGEWDTNKMGELMVVTIIIPEIVLLLKNIFPWKVPLLFKSPAVLIRRLKKSSDILSTFPYLKSH